MEIGDRAGSLLVGHIKAFKKIASKALKDLMPKLFGMLSASKVVVFVIVRRLFIETTTSLATMTQNGSNFMYVLSVS